MKAEALQAVGCVGPVALGTVLGARAAQGAVLEVGLSTFVHTLTALGRDTALRHTSIRGAFDQRVAARVGLRGVGLGAALRILRPKTRPRAARVAVQAHLVGRVPAKEGNRN